MNELINSKQKARLNPFLFPSDTDFRFALLIIAIIGTSIFFYYSLSIRLDSQKTKFFYVNIFQQCMSQFPTGMSLESFEAYTKCTEPASQMQAHWAFQALIAVIALLGTSTVVYSVFPLVMIRWERLALLKNQYSEEIVRYLEELCREIECQRVPVFLVKASGRSRGSRAFGALGKYYLVLPGGLVRQFVDDRIHFRTVILHELGHLKNKDIDKTYFAISIAIVFLVAAFLPYVLTSPIVISWDIQTVLDGLLFVLRVLMFAALAYLTLASIIRSREFYADLRASLWEESNDGLDYVLKSATQKRRGWHVAIAAFLERLPYLNKYNWQIAFQFHPAPLERCQILQDTRRLFYLSFWEALATGLASGTAVTNIKSLLFNLKGFDKSVGSLYITGFIFALLSIGIVGQGVWRGSLATLIQDKQNGGSSFVLGSGKLGLALGIGIILGQFISFSTETQIANAYIDQLSSSKFTWSLIFVVSLYCFFRWVEACSILWLRIGIIQHSFRLIYIIGLMIATGWLTLWFGFMFFVKSQSLASNSFPSIFSGVILMLNDIFNGLNFQNSKLYTFFALIILWAFPLSAELWRSQSRQIPSWIFLETVEQVRQTIHLDPNVSWSNTRKALKLGLLGGLIACVFLLLTRFIWGTPQSSSQLVAYRYVLISVASIVQASIAIVAIRRNHSSGTHALLTAFVTGCVASIGIIGMALLFGEKLSPLFVRLMLCFTVNWGAFLTLLVIFTRLIVSKLLGRNRQSI